MARIEALKEKYDNWANFVIIYIKEAHPGDEWQMEVNESEGIVFNQPKTMQERIQLAETFVEAMDPNMPVLVDDITNPANACYAAWPERIYVINQQGIIVYKGDMGPDGFDPRELEGFLEEYLKQT